MITNKPKISVATNRTKCIPEIKNAFEDFDVELRGTLYRKSLEDVAIQIMIFISGAFASGAVWDLFKHGIKKLFVRTPNAQIVIRDQESIMYTIEEDESVKVVVVPDRVREFEHIKTLDDLVEHLKSKNHE